MRLTFHGAAGSVTGSAHLVEVKGRRILIDCGLHQGRRRESDELNRQIAYDPSSLDAIILSHSHMDHSGNLPSAVKRGFDGLIVSTFATRDLAAIMLPDSAHIQKYDMEYLNRKRLANNLPPLEPLYTIDDVMDTLKKFMSIPYNRSFELFPGISLRFLEAGHILGSSQVELTIHEKGHDRVLLFSGDLGRPGRPILRDPDLSSRADILLLESTYGGRNHEEQNVSVQRFADIITGTYGRGGKVIIPSFSVGRTQEVLYYIHELHADGIMPPDMPVFVDSPLSFDATEIYKIHQECFDAEMIEHLRAGKSPFSYDGLHFIQSVGESKALNAMNHPMVIISASGMCENGRILHHLKNNVQDERSTVLVVGFMAANTLGRRLVEREPEVRIYGEEYKVNCSVEVINGFSAHAGSDELLSYAESVGNAASDIFLVHGEEDQTRALAKRINEAMGVEPHIPSRGEVFDL